MRDPYLSASKPKRLSVARRALVALAVWMAGGALIGGFVLDTALVERVVMWGLVAVTGAGFLGGCAVLTWLWVNGDL